MTYRHVRDPHGVVHLKSKQIDWGAIFTVCEDAYNTTYYEDGHLTNTFDPITCLTCLANAGET